MQFKPIAVVPSSSNAGSPIQRPLTAAASAALYRVGIPFSGHVPAPALVAPHRRLRASVEKAVPPALYVQRCKSNRKQVRVGKQREIQESEPPTLKGQRD